MPFNFLLKMKRINTLNGKVAIITGASSGIGLACAIELAENGATVILASRNISKLNNIVEELLIKGHKAIAVKTDVSVEDDCKKLINLTVEKFGRIDIIINNAGISMRALLEDVDTKVIRQLMEVNFFGTVYCTKYALPFLLKTKGSVVGITSIAGYCGLPGRSGYSASKFAIRGFLETIRVENIYNGLHVMIVAPGFTATNIRYSALTADGKPQGISPRNESKMMTAQQVAKKIAKGILQRRRSLIMTSEGKLSIIARKIFPSLTDKILLLYMAKEPDSTLIRRNKPT